MTNNYVLSHIVSQIGWDILFNEFSATKLFLEHYQHYAS